MSQLLPFSGRPYAYIHERGSGTISCPQPSGSKVLVAISLDGSRFEAELDPESETFSFGEPGSWVSLRLLGDGPVTTALWMATKSSQIGYVDHLGVTWSIGRPLKGPKLALVKQTLRLYW